MNQRRWIGTIIILVSFLLSGCQQIPASPTSVPAPDYLPISLKDVHEIKIYGWEDGAWRDGRVLSKEETAEMIGWLNRAKSLGTVDLPPEMAAPLAEITIDLMNEKMIQIFLWHDDLVMNYADSTVSYKFEQQDLENYLSQRIK